MGFRPSPNPRIHPANRLKACYLERSAQSSPLTYIGYSGISTNHPVFDRIDPFRIDLHSGNVVTAGVNDLELPFGRSARLVRIPQGKHDAKNKPHKQHRDL